MCVINLMSCGPYELRGGAVQKASAIEVCIPQLRERACVGISAEYACWPRGSRPPVHIE